MSTQSDATDPYAVIHHALQELEISLQPTPASLAETEHWLQNPGIDDPLLSDLTHLAFVTIDNEDSRDLDQALFLERSGDGYRIVYALADAAYYVRPGSALFNEALERGTTYYTPAMAASMLPPALSEGLISLNPKVDRRSLVFDMQLNASASVTKCDIHRARIRSRAKLSYAGVQHWLDSTQGDTEEYHPSLRLLREAGIKLITAGEVRGVVTFDRTETRVEITGSPPQFEAGVRSRVDTERYNEQLSLICNMQGAELLLGFAGVTDVMQAIFRVHEAPLKKSLYRLQSTLNALADAYPEPHSWHWQEGQSLAEFVAALPDDEKNRRRVRAIQRQIMMAQRASTFTPDADEHHALKANSYARFSSPMREVVGIFTHKELLEALSGERFDNDADHALREQVIVAANFARQQQRKLDKRIEFAALQNIFNRELQGESMRWRAGTIMGFRSDKLYISLDDLALDVKVYRNDLEKRFSTTYVVEDTRAIATDSESPAWYLGQGVELQVHAFETARQRFVFSMRPINEHN